MQKFRTHLGAVLLNLVESFAVLLDNKHNLNGMHGSSLLNLIIKEINLMCLRIYCNFTGILFSILSEHYLDTLFVGPDNNQN